MFHFSTIENQTNSEHLRAASSSRCLMMRVSAVRLTACMAPDTPLPDCRTTPPALTPASPLQRPDTSRAKMQLRAPRLALLLG